MFKLYTFDFNRKILLINSLKLGTRTKYNNDFDVYFSLHTKTAVKNALFYESHLKF